MSFGGIAEAAENIGLESLAVSVDFATLKGEVPLPCIAYWRQRHFIVVYEITKETVYVADPAQPSDADGGWLVGFVHHASRNETDLVVLDAADIARPPFASVRIPRRIPCGLHSTWLPSTDQ